MAAGNYEEAKNAAKSAKIWIIASAVVGLIVEVIYIIFAAYTIPTIPNGRQQHNVQIIDNTRYGTQLIGVCGA